MIITKKAISRRFFLRGVGVSLALPLLDGMVPALGAAKAAAQSPIRFGAIYVPNGIVARSWTPGGSGTQLELSRTLAALEPVKDNVVVLTGLSSRHAFYGTHSSAATKFLSDMPATRSAEIEAGTSLDQVVAQHFGHGSALASLELGLEASNAAGTCGDDLSCAYTDTIAWRSPTTPLPMERNPRVVFERMFGDTDSIDEASRVQRLKRQRSILDSLVSKVQDFNRGLGGGDRRRVVEYLDAVRDVERRVQAAETDRDRPLPELSAPIGIPDSYDDHAKLMLDLQVLAYQSDVTRVGTLMLGKELSGLNYAHVGISESHHPVSHHQNDPDKIEKLVRINAYHVSLLAYYLEKLKSTPDGDGSLLDRLALVYGSGLGDGNSHSPDNLAILVAGGANGAIKGGRHLRFPPETRLANLHVAMLNHMGIPTDQFGDSDGALPGLSL